MLTVEGSNPGIAVSFSSRNTQLKAGPFGQECACAVVGNVLLRMRETSIFGNREFDFLGGHAHAHASVYA